MISGKRQQKAVFQALASINRAAGSGAGSGFQVMNVLDDQITTDTSVNIATADATTYSSIAGTTVNFVLGRTLSVLFVATVSGKATAGAGGVFAYGKVFVDGTPYGSTQGGITAVFDSGVGGYVPNSVIFHLALAAGAHAADVRIATDNSSTHWLQYTTKLTAYALGT
jgi:hypothetical protein